MKFFSWKMCIWIIASMCLASTNHGPEFQFKKESVSQQNLISRSKMFWNGQQWIVRSSDYHANTVDNIHILAFMVQFQLDDDEMTTGNGQFMTKVSSDTVINAPPHDKPYFDHQLQSLANYYHTVSKGHLQLDWTVFPDVVTLSHEMGDYNPGTTEERTESGLVELARDAVLQADSTGIHFSDYDAFIIFHAGVGRDIELGYDPTPKDIPSVFLNQNDFYESLGKDYEQGIPVENGNFYVKEIMIFPETQNQEGFEFGMLGTMTLMFGFQLGLPALWDTDTGRSCAGAWAMMDQGSGNYSGMIPCEPCAFSKVFLGWETPIEVRNDSNLVVACAAASDPKKIYKVPINDSEYYLIENRRYDVNFDSVTYGTTADGKRIQFPSMGFLELEEPIDVIVSVDEYDYGLPGSGILIWHIDESVIRDHLSENQINNDPNRKGVDLEEADGAQDIGESYGFLGGGSGAESGVLHDAWFEDNYIHRQANKSKTVAFTPNSYPNTRSNDGANSHIVIDDFSKSDTLMTFSVTTDLFQKGFPRPFPDHLTPYAPIVIDLDGDRELEIIVVTEEGPVFGWLSDGTPIYSSSGRGFHVSVTGDTSYFTLPLFAQIDDSILCAPAAGDWDEDGISELFAATANGLYVLKIENESANKQANIDQFFPWEKDRPTAMSLNVQEGKIAVGFESGNLYIMDATGKVVAEKTDQAGSITGIAVLHQVMNGWIYTQGNQIYSGKVTDVQTFENINADILGSPVSEFSDQLNSIWGAADQGWYCINASEKETLPSIDYFKENLSPVVPALADLDQDGFVEGAITAQGQVYVFEQNAALVSGFPQPYMKRNLMLSSPVIGDVDGNPGMEIVIQTSAGNVEVWSATENLYPDFPLSTGGNQAITPVLEDVDADGDLEIVALSNHGGLYIWDLDAEYSETSVPWGCEAHDPARTGLLIQKFTPNPPDLNDWMPKHLAYNYPNPNEENFTMIRYRLEQTADVEIKIYDLSGETIDTFKGPGLAQADNEVRWDLTGVSSGVYICYIKASAQSETKELTFKIGVVK